MEGMTLLTDRAQAHRVSRAEFERYRDEREHDGARYELLDGEILVTPAPIPLHQRAVLRLARLLPLTHEDHELFTAPLDVVLPVADADSVLQPDLLLVRRQDITEKVIEGVPLLVVEVLSPTTWRRDLGPKRDTYAAAGVEHYWVVAPTVPSLTVYRLGADDVYEETMHVEGSQVARITEPVTLELRPSDLAS